MSSGYFALQTSFDREHIHIPNLFGFNRLIPEVIYEEMFPRSLGQISRPCSTSILRFVFCTTASDLPVCFQTIAVHCWQSDYFKLSALLVDLRSVNHHLFVNLATIELVRADLHIWTQLQICHRSSSLMLWTSILFNTFQYSSILWTQLQVCHPSSSSILWSSILFNTQYFADEKLLQLLQKQNMKKLT